MWFIWALPCLASGAMQQPWGKYRTMESFQMSKMMNRAGRSEGDVNNRKYFTQQQDHFDDQNVNTWQQAYYINDTFWKGASSNAPVFLCVGGEGPALTPAVTVNSVHCSNAVEWLPETGGLFFAVEHRYYGCHNMSACPVTSFSPSPKEALRFQGSKQALADLAVFHAHATKAYGLTASNKWVSWGGSYPGMLAGWFRVKYPQLVHAAVASSAPVHAKVEMSEYNDWTAFAYTVESVGGSEKCSANIADGHARIGKMMDTDEGRQELKSLFPQIPSADWLKIRSNRRDFAGEGVAYFPTQGNDPVCGQPACNIEKICAIMTDNATTTCNVKKLAQVSSIQSVMIEEAQRFANATMGDWADYWGYQTCTEFGFYQTCDNGSKCMYTQGLDLLRDQIAFCQTEFDISPDAVVQNVNNSNAYYGALHPDATRIIWPNGEVDPWSTLSILTSPGPEMPTLWVTGASHHAWTHAYQPNDQKSVKDARLAIRKQVGAWLEEA